MATALSPPPEPSEVQAAEPYKFLNFFEEKDRKSFAGRERDIQECLERATTSRVFVLYARSGFGKTSLLKAGVFPLLRERGLRPVYVRTLRDPVRDLRAAIAAEASLTPADGDGRRRGAGPIGKPAAEAEELARLIRSLPGAGRIVLVLDQFEEFFIRFKERRDVRRVFVETLKRLVDDLALDIHVVFSLREDYLANMGEFQASLPSLLARAYRLLPLTPFGAREAITRPLDQRNIKYSPTLVTRMLEELDTVDLDPPLIQIFCTEVYRNAIARDAANPELTVRDVEDVQGLDGIFRRYLEAVTKDPVLENNPLTARSVLDALLTREDTKRAATLEDLTSGRFRASEEEIKPILGVLVDNYLVRRSDREGVEWFELIHERLVDYVKEWLDRDVGFLNFRLAYDMVKHGSRGEYWRDRPDLLLTARQVEGVIGPFRARIRLTQAESEFVFMSALRSCSDEAGYWADVVGRERCTQMVLEALGGENRELRVCAASVAGAMPDPTGVLASACASLSQEPDEEIRRAGARSYTRLLERYGPPGPSSPATAQPARPPGPLDRTWSRVSAWCSSRIAGLTTRFEQPRRHLGARLRRSMPVLTPIFGRFIGAGRSLLAGTLALASGRELVKLLVSLVHSVRTRGVIGTIHWIMETFSGSRPDIDFLATRAEYGDPLLEADTPLWKRLFARSIAFDRKRRAQAGAVHDHAMRGAAVGWIAGGVWALTIGFLAYSFHESLITRSSYEDTTANVLLILVAPLLLSAFTGYLTGAADAQCALLSGRRFRPLRLSRSRIVVGAFGLVILFWMSYALTAVGGYYRMEWLTVSSNQLGWICILFILWLVLRSPSIHRMLRLGIGAVSLVLMGIVGWKQLGDSPWSLSDLMTQFGYLLNFGLLFGCFVIALALGLAFVESMIYMTSRCVGQAQGAAGWLAVGKLGIWVYAMAVSLPLVFLAVVNLPLHALTGEWVFSTEIYALAMSYLISVCVPARWYAWHDTKLSSPSGPSGSESSSLARGFGLVCIVAASLAFSRIWGFDSIRMFAQRMDLTTPGERRIQLTLGPADPEISLARLTFKEPSTFQVRGSSGPTDALQVRKLGVEAKETDITGEAIRPGAWLFAPQGEYDLVLRRNALSRIGIDAHGETVVLDLDRRDPPSSEGLGTPAAGRRTPFVLTPRRISEGVWSGRISGPKPEGSVRPLITLTNIDSESWAWPVEVTGAEHVIGPQQPSTNRFVVQSNAPVGLTPLNERAGGWPTPSRFGDREYLQILPRIEGDSWSVELIGPLTFFYEGPDQPVVHGTIESKSTSELADFLLNQPTAATPPPAPTAPGAPSPIDQARRQRGKTTNPYDASRNHWDQVVRLYREAIRDGDDGADVRSELADSLLKLGDLGAAIDEAIEARRRSGDSPDRANALAWYLCLAGRYGEALPLARAATAKNPGDWNKQDTLAHAAYGAGSFREAVDAWDKVLAARPGYFEDRQHLLCVEDRAKYEEARRRLGAGDLPRDHFAPSR
jgi:hypothetical protein